MCDFREIDQPRTEWRKGNRVRRRGFAGEAKQPLGKLNVDSEASRGGLKLLTRLELASAWKRTQRGKQKLSFQRNFVSNVHSCEFSCLRPCRRKISYISWIPRGRKRVCELSLSDSFVPAVAASRLMAWKLPWTRESERSIMKRKS